MRINIGKDEIGGSNPPSSSRKRPLFGRKVVFSFAIRNNFEQFKFPLLRLTTHLATDRKKSDLRGCFAPEARLFNLPDLLYLAALSPW